MDRKKLVKVEVGIKRDPSTKTLISDAKVSINGTFQKIYRDWPAGKASLEAARVWRTVIKAQHKRKHPCMKLRSNGTWVVRLPATDKFQALERDFGYEFGHALDWAAESYLSRSKGKWVDGSTTLQSIWNCYLLDGRLPSGSTLHSYESIWNNDLKAYWGLVLVSEISSKQVQKWIDGWKGTIPKLEHAHRVLRLVLSHAVDEDIIAFNPAYKRKLPNRAKPKAFAIPPAKLVKMQQHPGRESDRLAISLANQTGLRFSEWSVLRVSDLDTENLLVTVDEHQARDRSGRTSIHSGHKTSKTEKTAAITPELAKRLEKMIAENGLSNEDFLFPAPRGGVWRYNNFRSRVWGPALAFAGVQSVPYMTGTHSTRRTTVTVAHEAGLSAADIRGQTKHAGTKIILDGYLQTSEDAPQRVASAVQSSIGLPD